MAGASATRRRRPAGWVVLVLLTLALGGCRGCTSSRPPIHLNPNMDHQPKYRPQAESAFFYDGATMRTPVEGTVARGHLAADDAFTHGLDADGAPVATMPVTVDEALLVRGRERYAIYCGPCHGDSGNGRGVLYERAGVQSGNFHDERIRNLPDGQIFDVITHGVGLMPSYAYQVPVADRWAIIAHVRELQQEDAR